MPGPTEAQHLIGILHQRGWTDSAIGRMVGRDSSLIHQGATGKKPLRNLTGALNQIVESGAPGPKSTKSLPRVEVSAPERRRRASGTPAAVRRSRAEMEAERGAPRLNKRAERIRELRHFHREERQKAYRLPNGHIVLEGHDMRTARLAADIADGMSGNARVKLNYRGVDGQWHTLGRKGGINPEVLKAQLRGRRDWVAAMNELISIYYPGASGAGWGIDPGADVEFYVVTLGNA